MFRQPATTLPTSSRGLSAVAALTDAEKAHLFDHLQTAHANTVAARSSSHLNTTSAITESDDKDPTVYFSNVYSAVIQSRRPTISDDDMVLDTGADEFILKSIKFFIRMSPIAPVAIKTADGQCHLFATHRGDAEIDSFDDNGVPCKMIMPDALYCKDISVNLISAI